MHSKDPSPPKVTKYECESAFCWGFAHALFRTVECASLLKEDFLADGLVLGERGQIEASEAGLALCKLSRLIGRGEWRNIWFFEDLAWLDCEGRCYNLLFVWLLNSQKRDVFNPYSVACLFTGRRSLGDWLLGILLKHSLNCIFNIGGVIFFGIVFSPWTHCLNLLCGRLARRLRSLDRSFAIENIEKRRFVAIQSIGTRRARRVCLRSGCTGRTESMLHSFEMLELPEGLLQFSLGLAHVQIKQQFVIIRLRTGTQKQSLTKHWKRNSRF